MAVALKLNPRYCGAYGGRPLVPGDLRQLDRSLRETPWDAERLERVFSNLFADAVGRNEDYQQVRKELAALENAPGRPKTTTARKIERRRRDLADQLEWFESLDRRVYLCHLQMATDANPEWRRELVERYRFTLELQDLQAQAEEFAEKAALFTREVEEHDDAGADTIDDFMSLMRKAWKALRNIGRLARAIELPAWAPGKKAERLEDVILTEKLVPEPPEEFDERLTWATRLVDQLRSVRQKLTDLHEVNVVGILMLQEKIAAAWHRTHAPVEAVLTEPLAAEVLEAEVIHTGEVEADVVEAEIANPPLVFVSPPPVMAAPPPVVAAPPPPIVPAPQPAAAPIDLPPVSDAAMFSLDLEDYKPAPPAPPPLVSILVGTIEKPAKNGRPPLKITYVRAGEPSPLGK